MGSKLEGTVDYACCTPWAQSRTAGDKCRTCLCGTFCDSCIMGYMLSDTEYGKCDTKCFLLGCLVSAGGACNILGRLLTIYQSASPDSGNKAGVTLVGTACPVLCCIPCRQADALKHGGPLPELTKFTTANTTTGRLL